MPKTPYLTKRGGVWWWRRRPPSLRRAANLPLTICATNGAGASGLAHCAVSLRTGSQREARLRGARLSALFEFGWGAFEAAMDNADEQMMARARGEFALGMIELFRQQVEAAARFSDTLKSPLGLAGAAARQDAACRSAMVAAIPTPTTITAPPGAVAPAPSALDDPQFEDALIRMAEERGWWQEDPADILNEFDAMIDGLLVMSGEYVRHCVRRGLDPATALPSLARIATGLGEVAQATGVVIAPVEPPVAERDPTPLSVLAKRYLDLRCRGFLLQRKNEAADEKTGASFQANSRRNIEATVGLFIALFGDIPVADIEDRQCGEFVRLLGRIPATHGKSAKDERALRQVIAEADADEARTAEALTARLRSDSRSPGEIEEAVLEARILRLRTNTRIRHMRDFSRLLDFGVFDGVRSDNPMKDHLWTGREINNRTSRETGAQRCGWGDELPKLLATPIFREPLDDAGDPMFWAPMLALLAGLRMEEALQLRTDDFMSEDGIDFIAIGITSEGQRVKSQNAKRHVPIHRFFDRLGLMHFVESRRRNNIKRIFTHLDRGSIKGNFAETFTKRFTYYRKKQGIYKPTFDFHNLRTDFCTRLTRAQAPERVVVYFMGHSNADTTTKHYFRAGETLATLKGYINLIDFDIIGVRAPFPALEVRPVGKTELMI